MSNSYLRVAAHIATLLLIPVLIYFNSQINQTNNRLTAIETKMDARSDIRTQQLAGIADELLDHEGRIRFIETQRSR